MFPVNYIVTIKNVVNVKINSLLFAVRSLSIITIAMLVDDGLLRTSTGCTCPLSSLTLYDDSLKDTVIATR